MFHILSTAIANGYALPGNLLNQSGLNRKSLAEQLKVFPLMYDPEGRLKLPQKNKTDKKSKEITLVDMIGHSPDEADALAVAYYCMTKQPVVRMVGAV